jgi:hypothetical protein
VNQAVKQLFNLTPESFMQEFPKYIDQKFPDTIKHLATTQQAQMTFHLKNQAIPCQLGAIPTGLFKNHILGIIPL